LGNPGTFSLAILYGPPVRNSGANLGGTGLINIQCSGTCLPFTSNESLTAFYLTVHYQLNPDGNQMALVLSTDGYNTPEPYGHQLTGMGLAQICGPTPNPLPSGAAAVCGGSTDNDDIN
jgi:hypothetical protein